MLPIASNKKVRAALARFDQHKAVLAILREAYKRGPKSKPFDAKNAWWHLSFLAAAYFCRGTAEGDALGTRQSGSIGTEKLSAADRKKRLRELGKALSRARALTDKAMQDDFYFDLFSAWWEANGRCDIAPEITPVQIGCQFDKVVAGLSALETAACRAANNVHTRGRPSGAGVLPPSYIFELARIYLQSTGLKPDDCGPFVHLVREFLASIGQPKKATGDNVSPYYAEETIKYARKRARENPGVFALRPFDD
jgi:hypothetical protein